MTNPLVRIDGYLDAVPRSDADPELVGPFVLFKGPGGWPYYARPQHGKEAEFTTDDLADLADRCAQLDLKLNLEWVGELAPTLEPAARAFGLEVERHALLQMRADALDPGPHDGVAVLAPDDPQLLAARAVADVGFTAGGTDSGPAGVSERDERMAALPPGLKARMRQRAEAGLTVTAVAVDGAAGVVAQGAMQPVGDTAEIVGVATLPSHRRRGLAAAVTRALVAEARRRGVELVVLSAQSEPVARIYERVGFRRVGTALAASGAAP